MEASGKVKKIGTNVTKFNIGDKVTYCMNLGSFSKLINLNENKVIKLKNEVNLKIATASTLQGLTSQYLLHSSYKLKPNDTILIHAVAGSVGQILCQWAKNIGANIIGTVSTKEKEEIALQNGCDFTINYLKDDFSDRTMQITKEKSVNVIYDSVGKDTFLKGIKCLAPKGRIVSFVISSGALDPIDINMLRFFSGSIATGGLNTFIKNNYDMQKNANTFFDLIINKEVQINIEKIIPIEKIKKAQSFLESRKTTGSIVLSF